MIEIAPSGSILHAELGKTSPFESLNHAAITSIQKLGTLPPLPADTDGKPPSAPIRLKIPIRFQLL